MRILIELGPKTVDFRSFREYLGWDPKSLAAALGVKTTTISNWDNGRVKPWPAHREALAKLFGLRSADQIVFVP